MIYGEYILPTVTWREDREAQIRGFRELVRCAECVHRKRIMKADRCVIHDRTVKKSDFCSWGQWKERSE